MSRDSWSDLDKTHAQAAAEHEWTQEALREKQILGLSPQEYARLNPNVASIEKSGSELLADQAAWHWDEGRYGRWLDDKVDSFILNPSGEYAYLFKYKDGSERTVYGRLSSIELIPSGGPLAGRLGRQVFKAPAKAVSVAPRTVAPAKRATGETVLGRYPEYVKLSDELGARRFDVPEKVWNGLSDAEKWAANQKFLDRTIARGDKIRLASPVDRATPGKYFRKELDYLFGKGYKLGPDGQTLLPPGS